MVTSKMLRLSGDDGPASTYCTLVALTVGIIAKFRCLFILGQFRVCLCDLDSYVCGCKAVSRSNVPCQVRLKEQAH